MSAGSESGNLQESGSSRVAARLQTEAIGHYGHRVVSKFESRLIVQIQARGCHEKIRGVNHAFCFTGTVVQRC